MVAALVLESEMSRFRDFSTTAGAGRRKGGWSLRRLLDRESSLGIILMLPGRPPADGLHGLSLLPGHLALPHRQHDRPNGSFHRAPELHRSPRRLDLPPDREKHPDLRHGDGPLQGDAGTGTGHGSEQPHALQQSDPGSGDDAVDRAHGAFHARLVHDLRPGVQPHFLASQIPGDDLNRTSTSWAIPPWRSPRSAWPISGAASRSSALRSWQDSRLSPTSCMRRQPLTAQTPGTGSFISRFPTSAGWS